MRLHSAFNSYFESRTPESLEAPAAEEFEVDAQNEWWPYLCPQSDGLSEKLSQRLSAAGSPGSRRLVHDRDSLPALILATMITFKPSPSPRAESAVFDTPVEFRHPFQKHTGLQPTPPPQKPSHKHSYSLNDAESMKILVNKVTASGTPVPGQSGGGSLKRVKGRTFSIPQSELVKSEISIVRSPGHPQRRNITDPSVFRRPRTLAIPGSDLSSITPRSVSHEFNIGLRRQRPLTSDAVALSAWQHAERLDNSTYSSLRRRPKRHSIAASDPASTILGSDDTRVFTSCDEGETDMTDYWDSIRTRGTSGSGMKGLRIETMFDKTETRLSNEEITTLEELLPRASFTSRLEKGPQFFPATTLFAPSSARVQMNDSASIMSAEDEETSSMIGALPGEPEDPIRLTPLSPASKENASQNSFTTLAVESSFDDARVSQKMNIFDWSEQTRSDRELSDSEARPRTVHGKQNTIGRGSRAACRKVPSTIHLRSQSVPLARELAPNDNRQNSGKFGTWGLGSKGVSEDWDSDFDFDEPEEVPGSQTPKIQKHGAVPQSMTVPKAILERQASLHGQFGQVQELTLLVQELKRLRHQASILDLAEGSSSELWKEAEGIINLATIDDDEARRSPPASPSSLTFSFDDSDEEGINPSSKRNSEGSWQAASQQSRHLASPPFTHSKSNSEVSWQGETQHERTLPNSPLQQLSRPSPKSETVLDIVQPDGRATSPPFPDMASTPRIQKLPFDTQSLRDLVVRAGVVTRALKEVIRKAEGVVSNSQDGFPSDPPFRRIFDQPSNDHLASFEAALPEIH